MMYCPMCSGTLTTLYGENKYAFIACTAEGCPDTQAAAKILNDPETGHIVTFKLNGFSLRHPLRERLGDDLMNCLLHETLSMYDCIPPPLTAGRYRIPMGSTVAEAATWERLDGES